MLQYLSDGELSASTSDSQGSIIQVIDGQKQLLGSGAFTNGLGGPFSPDPNPSFSRSISLSPGPAGKSHSGRPLSTHSNFEWTSSAVDNGSSKMPQQKPTKQVTFNVPSSSSTDPPPQSLQTTVTTTKTTDLNYSPKNTGYDNDPNQQFQFTVFTQQNDHQLSTAQLTQPSAAKGSPASSPASRRRGGGLTGETGQNDAQPSAPNFSYKHAALTPFSPPRPNPPIVAPDCPMKPSLEVDNAREASPRVGRSEKSPSNAVSSDVITTRESMSPSDIRTQSACVQSSLASPGHTETAGWMSPSRTRRSNITTIPDGSSIRKSEGVPEYPPSRRVARELEVSQESPPSRRAIRTQEGLSDSPPSRKTTRTPESAAQSPPSRRPTRVLDANVEGPPTLTKCGPPPLPAVQMGPLRHSGCIPPQLTPGMLHPHWKSSKFDSKANAVQQSVPKGKSQQSIQLTLKKTPLVVVSSLPCTTTAPVDSQQTDKNKQQQQPLHQQSQHQQAQRPNQHQQPVLYQRQPHLQGFSEQQQLSTNRPQKEQWATASSFTPNINIGSTIQTMDTVTSAPYSTPKDTSINRPPSTTSSTSSSQVSVSSRKVTSATINVGGNSSSTGGWNMAPDIRQSVEQSVDSTGHDSSSGKMSDITAGTAGWTAVLAAELNPIGLHNAGYEPQDRTNTTTFVSPSTPINPMTLLSSSAGTKNVQQHALPTDRAHSGSTNYTELHPSSPSTTANTGGDSYSTQNTSTNRANFDSTHPASALIASESESATNDNVFKTNQQNVERLKTTTTRVLDGAEIWRQSNRGDASNRSIRSSASAAGEEAVIGGSGAAYETEFLTGGDGISGKNSAHVSNGCASNGTVSALIAPSFLVQENNIPPTVGYSWSPEQRLHQQQQPSNQQQLKQQQRENEHEQNYCEPRLKQTGQSTSEILRGQQQQQQQQQHQQQQQQQQQHQHQQSQKQQQQIQEKQPIINYKSSSPGSPLSNDQSLTVYYRSSDLPISANSSLSVSSSDINIRSGHPMTAISRSDHLTSSVTSPSVMIQSITSKGVSATAQPPSTESPWRPIQITSVQSVNSSRCSTPATTGTDISEKDHSHASSGQRVSSQHQDNGGCNEKTNSILGNTERSLSHRPDRNNSRPFSPDSHKNIRHLSPDQEKDSQPFDPIKNNNSQSLSPTGVSSPLRDGRPFGPVSDNIEATSNKTKSIGLPENIDSWSTEDATARGNNNIRRASDDRPFFLFSQPGLTNLRLSHRSSLPSFGEQPDTDREMDHVDDNTQSERPAKDVANFGSIPYERARLRSQIASPPTSETYDIHSLSGYPKMSQNNSGDDNSKMDQSATWKKEPNTVQDVPVPESNGRDVTYQDKQTELSMCKYDTNTSYMKHDESISSYQPSINHRNERKQMVRPVEVLSVVNDSNNITLETNGQSIDSNAAVFQNDRNSFTKSNYNDIHSVQNYEKLAVNTNKSHLGEKHVVVPDENIHRSLINKSPTLQQSNKPWQHNSKTTSVITRPTLEFSTSNSVASSDAMAQDSSHRWSETREHDTTDLQQHNATQAKSHDVPEVPGGRSQSTRGPDNATGDVSQRPWSPRPLAIIVNDKEVLSNTQGMPLLSSRPYTDSSMSSNSSPLPGPTAIQQHILQPAHQTAAANNFTLPHAQPINQFESDKKTNQSAMRNKEAITSGSNTIAGYRRVTPFLSGSGSRDSNRPRSRDDSELMSSTASSMTPEGSTYRPLTPSLVPGTFNIASTSVQPATCDSLTRSGPAAPPQIPGYRPVTPSFLRQRTESQTTNPSLSTSGRLGPDSISDHTPWIVQQGADSSSSEVTRAQSDVLGGDLPELTTIATGGVPPPNVAGYSSGRPATEGAPRTIAQPSLDLSQWSHDPKPAIYTSPADDRIRKIAGDGSIRTTDPSVSLRTFQGYTTHQSDRFTDGIEDATGHRLISPVTKREGSVTSPTVSDLITTNNNYNRTKSTTSHDTNHDSHNNNANNQNNNHNNQWNHQNGVDSRYYEWLNSSLSPKTPTSRSPVNNSQMQKAGPKAIQSPMATDNNITNRFRFSPQTKDTLDRVTPMNIATSPTSQDISPSDRNGTVAMAATEEEDEARENTRRMFSKTRELNVPKPVMKYRGVGPQDKTTGVPLTLRSSVDDRSHKDWYKQMYAALHKTSNTSNISTDGVRRPSSATPVSYENTAAYRSSALKHSFGRNSHDIDSYMNANQNGLHHHTNRGLSDYGKRFGSLIESDMEAFAVRSPADQALRHRKDRSVSPAQSDIVDYQRYGIRTRSYNDDRDSTTRSEVGQWAASRDARRNYGARAMIRDNNNENSNRRPYTADSTSSLHGRADGTLSRRERQHQSSAVRSSSLSVNTDEIRTRQFPPLHVLPPPEFTKITTVHGKARALYTFRQQKDRELSFKRGDIIHVLNQIDKNWYEASLHGRRGLVPANYLEILTSIEDARRDAIEMEGQATAKYNFQAQTPIELSLKKGDILTVVRHVDENWLEGRCNGRQGIFPISYVDLNREPVTPLLTPLSSLAPSPLPGSSPMLLSPTGSTVSSCSSGAPPSLPPSAQLSPTNSSQSFNFARSSSASRPSERSSSSSALSGRRGTDPYQSSTLGGNRRESETTDMGRVRETYRGDNRDVGRIAQAGSRDIDRMRQTDGRDGDRMRHTDGRNMDRTRQTDSRDNPRLAVLDELSAALKQNQPLDGFDITDTSTLTNRPRSADPYHYYNDSSNTLRKQNGDQLSLDSTLSPSWDQSSAFSVSSSASSNTVSDELLQRMNETYRRERDEWGRGGGRLGSSVDGGNRARGCAVQPTSVLPPTNTEVVVQTVGSGVKHNRCGSLDLPRYPAYRALYNYKIHNDDELEMKEGDIVYVMEICEDGWYVGTSKRTKEFGTFPGNYVERL